MPHLLPIGAVVYVVYAVRLAYVRKMHGMHCHGICVSNKNWDMTKLPTTKTTTGRKREKKGKKAFANETKLFQLYADIIRLSSALVFRGNKKAIFFIYCNYHRILIFFNEVLFSAIVFRLVKVLFGFICFYSLSLSSLLLAN